MSSFFSLVLKSAKRYELSLGVLATKDILQKTFSTSLDLGVEAPLVKQRSRSDLYKG